MGGAQAVVPATRVDRRRESTTRCSRSAQKRLAGLAIENVLYLASLQEPSPFEYRGHCLFDPRLPCHRLLGRGKVVQVTPLPTWCQRLERVLEPRVCSEPLRQLLGKRKI